MNKATQYNNAIGYAYASAAITIFVIFYLNIQPQIIAGNGFGWDGIEYHKYYEFFGGSELRKVNYPFCSRVGLPFIASRIWLGNAFLSFKIVNIAFAVIFSITTYAIARHHNFNRWYSLIALFLSANLFFSPIRFANFYPVYTDPAFLALTALALLSFLRKHYLLSFSILVAAQPIREAAVFVLIFFSAAAIYTEGFSKNLSYKILISLAAVFAIKFGINIFYDCHGSQLRTAIAYLHTRLTDPVSFVNYIAAILMTAAPIFFCKPSEMTKIKVIYTAGFIFSAALAFVGGSDATRIFFSFFPIYFVLIIDALKKQGYIFSIACLLGYVITNRVSRRILEPLNYWPAKDESGLFFQFPDHARPEVGLVIIVVWGFIFYLYGKIFPKKLNTGS